MTLDKNTTYKLLYSFHELVILQYILLARELFAW